MRTPRSPSLVSILLTCAVMPAAARNFSGLTEAADANLVQCVAIGDVNKDGKPDIVFTALKKLAWLRNLGGGAFADAVVIDATYESPLKVLLADMDKDGDVDVVVNIPVRSYETGKSGVNVYKNNGTGSFSAATAWDVFQNTPRKDFALSDFDGDGSPDVVSVPYALGANSGAYIELNSGSGDRKGQGENQRRYLIDNRQTYPKERNAELVAIANFDADANKDIVIGSAAQLDPVVGYGAVDTLRNQGAGIFALNTFTTLSVSSSGPFVNDLGYLQQGDAVEVRSISAANMDKLGSLDLIANQEFSFDSGGGNYSTVSAIYWWPNKGTFFSGTTSADRKLIGSQNRKIYAFTPLDFDKDGDDDVVVVYGSTVNVSSDEFEIQLLINDGSGHFTLPADGSFETLKIIGGLRPNAIAAADVNADGEIDFVLGGNFEVNGRTANGVRVYLNERVNPAPFTAWAAGYNLTGPSALKSADPDNDGNDNETEFADGTNPTLASSGILRLNAAVRAGVGTLTVSPVKSTYTRGETVTVTAAPSAPYLLRMWSGSASGKASPLVLTMNRSHHLSAHFGTAIEPALDAGAYLFSDGGDAVWTPVSSPSKIGSYSAQSGRIDHNQSTSMRTTVNGSGTVKFWWKCDSAITDYLNFRVDGNFQFQISGTKDWEQKTVAVAGPGDHVLEWTYEKSPSGIAGSDAGWVDGFQWLPPSGFDSWASAAGLAGNDALPLSAPRGDGLANLLKYAFNLNAAGPDTRILVKGTGTAGLPLISAQPGILRVEFLRRLGSGLIYRPRKSTDLSSWTPLTAAPSITPIDANWERVLYEEPVAQQTTPKSFGRVEVEIP